MLESGKKFKCNQKLTTPYNSIKFKNLPTHHKPMIFHFQWNNTDLCIHNSLFIHNTFSEIKTDAKLNFINYYQL